VTIIHKQGIKLSFAGFVKKAIPFAVMQIALAVAYVLVFL
jgi:Na+/H+ antiporter NhaD/arsenite permease-like protein